MKIAGRPTQSPAQRLYTDAETGDTFPFWLTSREAQEFVGCKSLKAFYMWRKRHGVVALNNGKVCILDLIAALRTPRKRHAMSVVSLSNLQLRHRSQPTGSVTAGSTSPVEDGLPCS